LSSLPHRSEIRIVSLADEPVGKLVGTTEQNLSKALMALLVGPKDLH